MLINLTDIINVINQLDLRKKTYCYLIYIQNQYQFLLNIETISVVSPVINLNLESAQ